MGGLELHAGPDVRGMLEEASACTLLPEVRGTGGVRVRVCACVRVCVCVNTSDAEQRAEGNGLCA
jgi:hypothetical protein